MWRVCMVGALVLSAVGAVAVWAQTAETQPQLVLGPYLTFAAPPFEFKAGERAEVVISGALVRNFEAALALYIYDPDGNCVARDDLVAYPVVDDAAVQWYPRETGLYTIEIQNQGSKENRVFVSIR